MTARTQFVANVNATFEVRQGDAVIRTIIDQPYPAGFQSVIWDGLLDDGSIAIDGIYEIFVIATADGVLQAESVTVEVDSTYPQINLDKLVDGYIQRTDRIITGTMSDRNLVTRSIGLREFPGAQAVNFTLLTDAENATGILLELNTEQFEPEGIYLLEFAAEDKAGNVARVLPRQVVDITPPEVIITNPDGNIVINKSSNLLTVTGSINDAFPSSYEVGFALASDIDNPLTLAQGVLPTGNELLNVDLTPLNDDIYAVSARAKDLAGQQTVVTRQVILDTIPPVAQFTSPGGGYVTEAFSVVGIASDQNFKQYQVAIAEAGSNAFADLSIGTGPVNSGRLASISTLPADGDYELRLTVADKADNVSAEIIAITE